MTHLVKFEGPLWVSMYALLIVGADKVNTVSPGVAYAFDLTDEELADARVLANEKCFSVKEDV